MNDNTSSEESAEDESLLSGSADYSTEFSAEFSEESASETDGEVLPYRFEPVAPVTEAHDGTSSGDEDEMGYDLDRLGNTTW